MFPHSASSLLPSGKLAQNTTCRWSWLGVEFFAVAKQSMIGAPWFVMSSALWRCLSWCFIIAKRHLHAPRIRGAVHLFRGICLFSTFFYLKLIFTRGATSQQPNLSFKSVRWLQVSLSLYSIGMQAMNGLMLLVEAFDSIPYHFNNLPPPLVATLTGKLSGCIEILGHSEVLRIPTWGLFVSLREQSPLDMHI